MHRPRNTTVSQSQLPSAGATWAQGRGPAGAVHCPLHTGPPGTPQCPPSQTHPQPTPHTRALASERRTAHAGLNRLTPDTENNIFCFRRPFGSCPAEVASPRRQFTGKVRSHGRASLRLPQEPLPLLRTHRSQNQPVCPRNNPAQADRTSDVLFLIIVTLLKIVSLCSKQAMQRRTRRTEI